MFQEMIFIVLRASGYGGQGPATGVHYIRRSISAEFCFGSGTF